MQRRPLLAELHAHTTWSDGELVPAELIDLYGRAGFDVLAVTDHVVHSSANANYAWKPTVPTSKSWTPRLRAPGGGTAFSSCRGSS
jgi:histidinol phosphatase-like PHP family hydrolase